MMDVQQSITMLLTSHFASDSVDNDVDIIPKMLLLPLVEERLHDFVLNEVLRYLLQLQEEDVEQALALIDPVEAFRSSQKLHGIVQVLAYFIHPTSPAEQQNSFVDKVMLDRLDSKSFNVLISLFQNMLTLMLNDFKTISDQLLTSLDDVDNKTAVGTAAITSIMPVLSYFQDPLDGKVKAYSRVSNIAIWLDLVQIEDDEENEENDLPSFTDVYLMIKKWCYEQLYGSSNSKPSSASKSRKSSSPLKDSTFANKRLYALLKRMETVENKLTAFHDLIANSGLALVRLSATIN